MALSRIEVIAAVGVAAWTASSAALTGTQIINERRDVVLIGALKDVGEVKLPHRELILSNDWLPMYVEFNVLVLAAAFGIVVFLSRSISSKYRAGFWFAGCVFIAFVAGQSIRSGLKDYGLMKSTLEEAHLAEARKAVKTQ